MEGFDGVGAGEEEPIESFVAGSTETSDGGVECGEGRWRDDLDGGDEDGDCAESFELHGEFGGLTACAGDEDAFASQGHGCSL